MISHQRANVLHITTCTRAIGWDLGAPPARALVMQPSKALGNSPAIRRGDFDVPLHGNITDYCRPRGEISSRSLGITRELGVQRALDYKGIV